MAFNRELMRGSLDLMILSVLADGPAYGYLIQKRIHEASADEVRLQVGTLYRLLNRLEQGGLVEGRWDRSEIRNRKWYELTAAGRQRLEEQSSEWDRYVSCIRKLMTAIRPAGLKSVPLPDGPEV